MNYHEVKAEFLAYEERRNKLYLFFIEIINNIKIAERLLEQANYTIIDDGYLHFSTLKFETDLMNNLLPDIFAIIQGDHELIKDVLILRLQMGPVNTKITTFHQLAVYPDKMNFQLQTHNNYIKKNVTIVLNLLKKIRKYLESKHGLTSPVSDSELEIF